MSVNPFAEDPRPDHVEPGLQAHLIAMSEGQEGDIFVDERFPSFFGRRITAIAVNEDSLAHEHGRQISWTLERLGGVTARERTSWLVLR